MSTQLSIKQLGLVALLTVLYAVTAVDSLYAGGNKSAFKKLSSDLEIVGTSPSKVLRKKITFNNTRTVLVVADGRYYPTTNPGGELQ